MRMYRKDKHVSQLTPVIHIRGTAADITNLRTSISSHHASSNPSSHRCDLPQHDDRHMFIILSPVVVYHIRHGRLTPERAGECTRGIQEFLRLQRVSFRIVPNDWDGRVEADFSRDSDFEIPAKTTHQIDESVVCEI